MSKLIIALLIAGAAFVDHAYELDVSIGPDPVPTATRTPATTNTPTPVPPPTPTTGISEASLDRAALEALYRATGGRDWWRNANWLSDAPLRTWYGVDANDKGRVTTLDLHDNQLRGEIPSELGTLSNLRVLSLYDNRLRGEIPSELGTLSNLRVLSLYDNRLSGEIPYELGVLSNLESLYLNGNQLEGGDTSRSWQPRQSGRAIA